VYGAGLNGSLLLNENPTTIALHVGLGRFKQLILVGISVTRGWVDLRRMMLPLFGRTGAL